MKTRICLVFGFVAIASVSVNLKADAFKTFRLLGGNIHERISLAALRDKLGLKRGALRSIYDGNTEEDTGANFFKHPDHHFDNCLLDETKKFIAGCWDKIGADAATADSDPAKRTEMLTVFGRLLHPCQDFYSHSNYVELMLQQNPSLSPANIPIVNWNDVGNGKISSSFPSIRTGYYSLLEQSSRDLAYKKLTKSKAQTPSTNFLNSSAYKRLDSYDKRIAFACNPNLSFLHHDLNKDNEETDEGKVLVPGSQKTLFYYAESVAVMETLRQWGHMVSVVREKAGVNSASLLEKLREGS